MSPEIQTEMVVYITEESRVCSGLLLMFLSVVADILPLVVESVKDE